ncbi:uncharacterized protein LOC116330861 [Oreochromis aureus]|uniref:uncharacterized protein LOC116330861 n=1 Tax=Oreochromis aureus TaxID=47969 RepID=UPI0012BCF516|nr:uncharacterized protein LOC116330861 [Oreochromis aureus]
MNKIPSDGAGGLGPAQLDSETIATPRLRDVSHVLQMSLPGCIEPELEDIICPPLQSSNVSDRPNTLLQPFNCGTASSEELIEEERLFLKLFIEQLVAHIEIKTRTPTRNVDLSKLEAHVRARTPLDLRFTDPKAFDKVLIPIYKDLCKKFGSKYLLLAALDTGDVAFEAAVAEGLTTRLTASAQKPDNLLKRLFSKRSFKFAPFRDVKPCHTDENSQNDRKLVPPLMNRKGDGVRKRLSSMASAVKKRIGDNFVTSECQSLDFFNGKPQFMIVPLL